LLWHTDYTRPVLLQRNSCITSNKGPSLSCIHRGRAFRNFVQNSKLNTCSVFPQWLADCRRCCQLSSIASLSHRASIVARVHLPQLRLEYTKVLHKTSRKPKDFLESQPICIINDQLSGPGMRLVRCVCVRPTTVSNGMTFNLGTSIRHDVSSWSYLVQFVGE